MSKEPRIPDGSPVPAHSYFDEEDYRFCCCHVRRWAKCIAILGIIGGILGLASDILHYSNNEASAAIMIGTIVARVLSIATSGIMLFGVNSEKRLFLVPYMVMGVIGIILCFVAGVLCFVAGNTTMENDTDAHYNDIVTTAVPATGSVYLSMGFVYIVAALIGAVFLYPVFLCYRYLKHKEMATTNLSMATVDVEKNIGY